MKLVIQRVSSASVTCEGNLVGSIDKGLLVLVGISKDFNDNKLDWMVKKTLNLRLWASSEKDAVTPDILSAPLLEAKPRKKGFDLSVNDIKGEILVVSQFTLHGVVDGNKPNFKNSAEYEFAKIKYEEYICKLRESGLKVETGQFGDMMQVSLVNNGPVTIILEK